MWIFKVWAYIVAFWYGRFCIHEGRTFRRGKIYCSKCGVLLGKVTKKRNKK